MKLKGIEIDGDLPSSVTVEMSFRELAALGFLAGKLNSRWDQALGLAEDDSLYSVPAWVGNMFSDDGIEAFYPYAARTYSNALREAFKEVIS